MADETYILSDKSIPLTSFNTPYNIIPYRPIKHNIRRRSQRTRPIILLWQIRLHMQQDQHWLHQEILKWHLLPANHSNSLHLLLIKANKLQWSKTSLQQFRFPRQNDIPSSVIESQAPPSSKGNQHRNPKIQRNHYKIRIILIKRRCFITGHFQHYHNRNLQKSIHYFSERVHLLICS